MTNERKQTNYNKLIGKIDNQYYFLDYIFNHGDGLKGATGTVMEVLTKEECKELNDQTNDDEEMLFFWKQAVEANRTQESFVDWLEIVKDEQGEDAGLDDSNRNEYMPILQELLGEDQVYTTNCTGGGRYFDKNMKWDELYAPELWELIKQAENQTK